MENARVSPGIQSKLIYSKGQGEKGDNTEQSALPTSSSLETSLGFSVLTAIQKLYAGWVKVRYS